MHSYEILFHVYSSAENSQVKLGYIFMTGTEYFVLLLTWVIRTN
jgi:hypothetical protein